MADEEWSLYVVDEVFVFDPWRSAIFLVAGDKSGRWREWYVEAIPLAEARYQKYLSRRAEDEGEGAS